MIMNHSCLDEVSVWDEEDAELGAKDAQVTIKAHILVLQETQQSSEMKDIFTKRTKTQRSGAGAQGMSLVLLLG